MKAEDVIHRHGMSCIGAIVYYMLHSTSDNISTTHYADGSDAYKSNVKPTDKWANIGGKGTIKSDGPIGKCWR